MIWKKVIQECIQDVMRDHINEMKNEVKIEIEKCFKTELEKNLTSMVRDVITDVTQSEVLNDSERYKLIEDNQDELDQSKPDEIADIPIYFLEECLKNLEWVKGDNFKGLTEAPSTYWNTWNTSSLNFKKIIRPRQNYVTVREMAYYLYPYNISYTSDFLRKVVESHKVGLKKWKLKGSFIEGSKQEFRFYQKNKFANAIEQYIKRIQNIQEDFLVSPEDEITVKQLLPYTHFRRDTSLRSFISKMEIPKFHSRFLKYDHGETAMVVSKRQFEKVYMETYNKPLAKLISK